MEEAEVYRRFAAGRAEEALELLETTVVRMVLDGARDAALSAAHSKAQATVAQTIQTFVEPVLDTILEPLTNRYHIIRRVGAFEILLKLRTYRVADPDGTVARLVHIMSSVCDPPLVLTSGYKWTWEDPDFFQAYLTEYRGAAVCVLVDVSGSMQEALRTPASPASPAAPLSRLDAAIDAFASMLRNIKLRLQDDVNSALSDASDEDLERYRSIIKNSVIWAMGFGYTKLNGHNLSDLRGLLPAVSPATLPRDARAVAVGDTGPWPLQDVIDLLDPIAAGIRDTRCSLRSSRPWNSSTPLLFKPTAHPTSTHSCPYFFCSQTASPPMTTRAGSRLRLESRNSRGLESLGLSHAATFQAPPMTSPTRRSMHVPARVGATPRR
eukprot:m.24046 g.24046  ORF g.24046 m.24046 type:complete len:381 (+) comp3967_c0_seq2:308-1450(+)